MSVEIKYNGNTIASVESGKIATIPCKGKKMAGNIVVKGDSDIKYKGATLATLSNGQTATIPCNGKIMQDNITVIALGTHEQPTQGLAYELSSDGTYYICTGIGTATDTDIIIASEIDGIPVTKIRGYAFSSNRTIISAKIPNSVTIMGDGVFEWCENLKKVVMPDGVTAIGELTFKDCSSLTEIVIPDKVERILREAFNGCVSLNEIVIPSWVAMTGYGVFYGCDNLTIYCEVQSQPPDWNSLWNPSNCPVVWGNKPLISFRINNTEHKVLKGVTWEEISKTLYWNPNCHMIDNIVYFDTDGRRLLYNGNSVYVNDLIIENGVYISEEIDNGGGSN